MFLKNEFAKRELSNLADLKANLTSRPLNIIKDYLSPTPSHLLNVSLHDFLPSPFHKCVTRYLARTTNAPYLPVGHHIVYFPSPISHRLLLPDGTDTDHSPGEPFTRRMWAGGSIQFLNAEHRRLRVDGTRVVCIEGIRDVTIKGAEGDEKVVVHVERRIGTRAELSTNDYLTKKYWPTEVTGEAGLASIVERRNLIFMRDKTPEQAKLEASQVLRIISRMWIFTSTYRLAIEIILIIYSSHYSSR